MQLHWLVVKAVAKWNDNGTWTSLNGWNVHVSHIFMQLPLQLGAAYYFCQLKFYVTCLKQLKQIIVTCDIYNWKIVEKH
jgi:hypothetical protein